MPNTCTDRAGGVAKVVRLVTERIRVRFGLDRVRDVQVLCPMNRGGLGACALNLEARWALDPSGEVRVERFGWTSSVGDKLMQVENDDKDVYNGDRLLFRPRRCINDFRHPSGSERPSP